MSARRRARPGHPAGRRDAGLDRGRLRRLRAHRPAGLSPARRGFSRTPAEYLGAQMEGRCPRMVRVWRWGAAALILLLIAAVPLGWRPAPAGAAAEQLTIGHSIWVGYGPLFLARDKRFFDEAGVAVELPTVEDPKLRFAALAAGKLDGSATTVDTMSLYWKRNFQFRA